MDWDQPAGECRDLFESEDRKAWLDYRLDQAEGDLEQTLMRMNYFAPDAERVLVGYPRLVPKNTTKCLTDGPRPDGTALRRHTPGRLPLLDQVQKRLDDRMKKAAADNGADFVDLYANTGSNTACDGANRGIGGLLETSKLEPFGTPIPWYAHPNEKGRDIQAKLVAATIEAVLNH
ncbi:hypothetical protein [Streptomyces sp. NPDC029554]|uniref:hypothetical protein n=1 Tax=Streptomyces sp. NPDC029554 TaxID=3155126 RepID=UPI0033FDC5CC